MSHTVNIALHLGDAYTSLTDLVGQLLTASGAPTGDPQTTIIEDGVNGDYLAQVEVPDDWSGFVRFHSPSTPELQIPYATVEAPVEVDLTSLQDSLNELNQIPTFHLNRGVPSIYELRKGLGYA